MRVRAPMQEPETNPLALGAGLPLEIRPPSAAPPPPPAPAPPPPTRRNK
jgi:hypothetical protein